MSTLSPPGGTARLQEGGETVSHRRWYGGGNDGDRGSVAPRSRRASVVLAGALGLMAVVLVIAPADLGLAKTGMMKRVNPSADREAGTFVVRETDTLLGRAAAEVQLQQLFGMSSVTRAAQRELASDETTLKSLSTSRGWGGGGDGDAQPQDSDGGPAGAIIASATAVFEKASKLAGDPARSPRLSLGGAAQATEDDDVSAEADAVASTVSAAAPKPFAKDKSWSLAKEKSDMDNFYDSLDHNLVRKEAAARKKRAADAEFRATVAKAHEELKAIETKTAAKPAEHATTPPKDPKAVSKPAAATAASPAVAHLVVKADPQVVRTTHAHAHAHVRNAWIMPHMHAVPQVAKAPVHAVLASTATPSKMPKLSSEASREKITSYFDTLVDKARTHADLGHPAEKHQALSTDAARKTISSYFDSLKSSQHVRSSTESAEGTRSPPPASKRLSDAQARAGALSFYDGEVSKARAAARLVAKKLGVRERPIASMAQVQADEHLHSALAKSAHAQEASAAPSAALPAAHSEELAMPAKKAANIAAASAQKGAEVQTAVKSAKPAASSSVDKAASAAYSAGWRISKKVRYPASPAVAPKAAKATKAPVAKKGPGVVQPVLSAKAGKTGKAAKAAARAQDAAKAGAQAAATPHLPLTKSAAHALAVQALREHDAIVAAQQKEAEDTLLTKRKKPLVAPKSTSNAAGGIAPKAGKASAVTAAHQEVKQQKVRAQLEQWPYVP